MFVDVKKYNLLRAALVSNPDIPHDVVRVKPRTFALKKEHDGDVLLAAREIFHDAKVIHGITPMDTVRSLYQDVANAPMEVIVYTLMCYAVAIQQGWLMYSSIINKYHINCNNKEIVEYAQDFHKVKIQ